MHREGEGGVRGMEGGGRGMMKEKGERRKVGEGELPDHRVTARLFSGD